MQSPRFIFVKCNLICTKYIHVIKYCLEMEMYYVRECIPTFNLQIIEIEFNSTLTVLVHSVTGISMRYLIHMPLDVNKVYSIIGPLLCPLQVIYRWVDLFILIDTFNYNWEKLHPYYKHMFYHHCNESDSCKRTTCMYRNVPKVLYISYKTTFFKNIIPKSTLVQF